MLIQTLLFVQLLNINSSQRMRIAVSLVGSPALKMQDQHWMSAILVE